MDGAQISSSGSVGFSVDRRLTHAARAQEPEAYPTRVIWIVVPLAAGGVTDTVARTLAERLQRALGQPVVIENRTGGGGAVGAEAVARSPADGYTLLMGTVSSNAINASLYRNLRYDNIKDFAPISLVASGPNMLVVHPSVPATTTAELIKFLKANPGKYSYGSAGVGTSTHLLTELFKQMTGTDVTHVPYRGSGPMMTDMIAGVVQMSFDNMPTALAQVRAGNLRALGVTSSERWPTLPMCRRSARRCQNYSGVFVAGSFRPGRRTGTHPRKALVRNSEDPPRSRPDEAVSRARDARQRQHARGIRGLREK